MVKPFQNEAAPSPSASGGPVVSSVAENSHRIGEADENAVVLTEFLDFECEACAAVHPYVEDLRAEYGGKVQFVLRYFPLPGHPNSGPAALAAEASAQQGKLEEMYNKLLDSQEEWSHSDESRANVFRGYAEELGFDMAAYDAAIADPATEDRVRYDFDAAVELGLQGTPSIFVDDRLIRLTSLDDIRDAIDAALKARA
ncbi:DsbA family protein [Mycetocola tolaasinivorans]|nr:thioredoxin domain-containing protein [Mycetocola tolaasinivorans]